jgi:hypothetical protein
MTGTLTEGRGDHDMKGLLFALAFLLLTVVLVQPCSSQDPLAKHMVNGLKELRAAAPVLRLNLQNTTLTEKEWCDMILVGLHRAVPELKLPDPKDCSDWLELSVITSSTGAELAVSVLRRVKILDSGEEVVAKVWWDSRAIFNGVSKEALREGLDVLLTSFAADYLRANK